MFTPSLPHAVRLISADGEVWPYPSLNAFIKAHGLAWIRASVGTQFRVRACIDPELELGPVWHEYPFILRGPFGEPITLTDCERLWEEQHPWTLNGWFFRRYPFWRGRGPVPGTGHCNAGSHYFRAIKTYPSHRAAAGVVPGEGEPGFRGRRARQLPSAWDDRHVSARRNRSWKRHRRTQYAPRNERGFG